jgi:hypothetical protein
MDLPVPWLRGPNAIVSGKTGLTGNRGEVIPDSSNGENAMRYALIALALMFAGRQSTAVGRFASKLHLVDWKPDNFDDACTGPLQPTPDPYRR